MKKSPHKGGCWYCHDDDPPLVFSCEFDTYIHKECIILRAIEMAEKGEEDPENEVFLREFKLRVDKKAFSKNKLGRYKLVLFLNKFKIWR